MPLFPRVFPEGWQSIYLDHPSVRDWLHRVYSVGQGDGSALVQALGSPRDGKPGLTDNCATADTLLEWFVAREWVIPVKYNPSTSQKFFGVGGRAPGRHPRKNVEWHGSHTYAQEWSYRPNTENRRFLAWLGLRLPSPSQEVRAIVEGGRAP